MFYSQIKFFSPRRSHASSGVKEKNNFSLQEEKRFMMMALCAEAFDNSANFSIFPMPETTRTEPILGIKKKVFN